MYGFTYCWKQGRLSLLILSTILVQSECVLRVITLYDLTEDCQRYVTDMLHMYNDFPNSKFFIFDLIHLLLLNIRNSPLIKT